MMSEAVLGYFGDMRRAATGAVLLERVVAVGSLVVRQLGGDRAGEMAAHRFLSSSAVTVAEMVETVAERTARACQGRRIVAVQDTTEVNFAGHERRRKGLGPAGNGKALGFFLHPVVAVDIETEAVLGIVDAQIWTRGAAAPVPRRQRGLQDKESMRWLTGMEQAAARLAEADELIIVEDREGDIYSQFARRPETVQLIVRAAQDRALADGASLFATPASWSELGRLTIQVPPRRTGERGRKAVLAVRAGQVTLKRPRNGYDRSDPPTLTLNLVEVREMGEDGEPLLWRLLTTLPVASFEQADEVARLYRLRWRIEQVFRALKSDGLKLEDVQTEHADRLFKLAVIGLIAAARTLQLVDARHGGPRPASDVIDPSLLAAAEAINRSKQGKTERQKNLHPPHSLAWLAWIIARLGGWNCYYKPPGPKTMRTGWNQFAAMAAGFTLAQTNV
jgi:hypothetical protein